MADYRFDRLIDEAYESLGGDSNEFNFKGGVGIGADNPSYDTVGAKSNTPNFDIFDDGKSDNPDENASSNANGKRNSTSSTGSHVEANSDGDDGAADELDGSSRNAGASEKNSGGDDTGSGNKASAESKGTPPPKSTQKRPVN